MNRPDERKRLYNLAAFRLNDANDHLLSLSMSPARSRATSLARNPQPYASVSIA
jgi:hypothetical protein